MENLHVIIQLHKNGSVICNASNKIAKAAVSSIFLFLCFFFFFFFFYLYFRHTCKSTDARALESDRQFNRTKSFYENLLDQCKCGIAKVFQEISK